MKHEPMDDVLVCVVRTVNLLNRLAANDSTKQMMVDAGVLPCYVKLMQPEWEDQGRPGREDEVRAAVAEGLWILGTNFKEVVLNHNGCVEGFIIIAN